MNISQVAAHAGIPAKTIRYYEDIGLIKPQRSDNGYRSFRDSDAHKLTFIAHARALGFSIDDCRTLLALWGDQARASADVRALAKDHLTRIDQKIADLRTMHATLSHLVSACAGDDRPDCPILKGLAKRTTP
jgi:MerR family copper efflux transcriptional regulator